MPKVSVYIGKELHRQLVDQGVPITRVCQVALAEAVDSPITSTGTRIRGLAQALVEVAESYERRGASLVETLVGLGVDVEDLFAALPWARAYTPASSGGARPALAGVDGGGAVEGGDTG